MDACENFWGYPGTQSVAAGKIRDASDYSFLISVNYLPVLESNTSLIEGIFNFCNFFLNLSLLFLILNN